MKKKPKYLCEDFIMLTTHHIRLQRQQREIYHSALNPPNAATL